IKPTRAARAATLASESFLLGGMSAVEQKIETGEVKWKDVAVSAFIPVGLRVPAAAKKGTQKIAEKGLKKAAERGVVRFATKVASTAVGAAARTVAMPHRVLEGYAERQVNASLEFTEAGTVIAKESREKPFTSAMKAFGDVVIENFSEVAGPTIGRIGRKFIPRKMANALSKLFKKLHPKQSVKRLFTKVGYDGFLQELGEERLGALMRAVTGVEDFGADDPDSMFDRIIASIPNGEELLVEAGVLSFPGVDPVAFHTIMGNRSIMGQLPTKGSPYTNPTYYTITGVQGDTGDEKNTVCEDAPTAGLMKACLTTSVFGRYERATPELELNRLGQRNDRA
ncbi:hypothetical protein LCGC14_3134550, partial [marine sediment metagenome]